VHLAPNEGHFNRCGKAPYNPHFQKRDMTRLIREHRVAVIPGTAFGLDENCYRRVAFGALEPETAAEGTRRRVRGLRAITGVRPG
jgi:aspartate/methionine/tyrosine aminotransferase